MSREQEYLGKCFSQYYAKWQPPISHVEAREFGFRNWQTKIAFRHLSFPNAGALSARLSRDAPPYVSYSAAYYEFPDARPMPNKNWKGADLIFDLDAPAHTCGKFTCTECMGKIRGETIRLIEDFLVPDFGISKDEMIVNFSGSRGFHVHVKSESVHNLRREERREIVEYINASSVSVKNLTHDDSMFIKEDETRKKVYKFYGPLVTDGGWRGKIAKRFLQLVREKKLHEIGIPKKKAQELYDKYEEVETTLKTPVKRMDGGVWANWTRIGLSGVYGKMFEALVENTKVAISADMDSNVTFDTSKLLRLPDSIHGGSGFAARLCGDKGHTLFGKPTPKISEFEPHVHAPVFSDEPLKMKITEEVPSVLLRSGGMSEKYAKDAVIDVPHYFGIYLMCKGAAILA